MRMWEEKRLENLVEVNPPVKLNKGEEYPFIDIDKVSPSVKRVSNAVLKQYEGQSSSKFKDGDTVFSRITPCLENRKIAKVKITMKAGFGSTEFFVFRAKKGLSDEDFVYYLTSSDLVVLPAINSMTGASGRQRADKKFIQRLKLMLPDLPTQKRIANILSTYDDLIEINNHRIELLEKAAQELYKEWFVRFRFPDYMQSKFVSGLPKGWEIKQLGDVIDIGSSKRVYLSDYVEAGVPFYRSKEIIQLSDGLSITEPLFISKEKYEEFATKFGSPVKNDILITSVGTIGESYLSDGHKFYFKDGNLTWLKTSQYPQLAMLIFCWLNTDVGKQTLNAATIGTSQSALTIESLKKIKICIPDETVLKKFYGLIVTIYEEKMAIQKQKQNLIKQRDLLIPRLMSGRLEV